MISRPSILFISTPLPRRNGTGAEIRSFFLLKAASQVGDVTLVCLQSPSGKEKAEFERVCARVVFPGLPSLIQRRSPNRALAWLGVAAALLCPWRQGMLPYLQLCSRFTLAANLNGRRRFLGWLLLLHQWLLSRLVELPPMALIWRQFAFTEIARRFEESAGADLRGFDLVWLETTAAFGSLSQLLERFPCEAPVVLSAHNIEWMIPKRQAAEIRDALPRWATRLQADLMRRFERRAHRACTLAIHCSPQDAELAKDFRTGARIVCIGNGVDIHHYRPSASKQSDSPVLIYTGNFDYQPNVDAALRLVRNVFPLIEAVVPQARLVIAGRNAASLCGKLSGELDWLTLVSNPEDMRPLLDEAWMTVIPLHSGSGTRLKILEAMAMKVPVISTAIGAEGLGAVDGDVLLIRESAEAQAGAAVQLLQDATARSQLADRASKWVSERYSWDRLVQQTVGEVQQIVAGH